MHIKTAHFFTEIRHAELPCDIENGKLSPKHYISILMMYLCKFSHNISTRSLDKRQISFTLPRVGYFGIVLGMEKSSYICILMFTVFRLHIVSFGSSQ